MGVTEIIFELSTLFTDKVITLQSQKKWSKMIDTCTFSTRDCHICNTIQKSKALRLSKFHSHDLEQISISKIFMTMSVYVCTMRTGGRYVKNYKMSFFFVSF